MRKVVSKLVNEIKWNSDNLVPVIAQQYNSNEILMMAWMSPDSLIKTIETGYACYWSRSRGKLWTKGESSGQKQKIKDIILDCDQDTLLIKVDQQGVACHTGRRSCFYRVWQDGDWKVVTQPEVDPKDLYGKSK